MRYYATVGPMKMITKGDSCGLFRSKKHAMTPDEARSFFYNSESIAGFLVFLFENLDDAKIAAAHTAASLCDMSDENKFLKPKAYTAPIYEVEVPDGSINVDKQPTRVKFTSDVEKKVASYFGVKNLDEEKTFHSRPCMKMMVTDIISCSVLHPYFRHKVINLKNAEEPKHSVFKRP